MKDLLRELSAFAPQFGPMLPRRGQKQSKLYQSDWTPNVQPPTAIWTWSMKELKPQSKEKKDETKDVYISLHRFEDLLVMTHPFAHFQKHASSPSHVCMILC
jgi:hypothetical protein